MKKIYITTPIFYVNDKPHLGHLHTCFLGDFFSRSYKLFNYEVYFLTGTDEHGQKIENTGKKLGISPKELVDTNSKKFQNFMKNYNIDYSKFIRTTDEDHKNNVIQVWNKLVEKKYLYRGVYKGFYSEKDECFYSLEEITNDENGQLVGLVSGNKVEEIEEECWFFKLSHFKEKLLQWYKIYPIIPKNLVNELRQYVENLKDLCVSRKTSWGIKVPNSTNETIYVWIDALFNYISAIGSVDKVDKDYWTNSLHILGKDISIFHGVYWPALLMALELEPPKKLLVHNWWLINNNKMSKSKGNVIDPLELKILPDYIRYYCINTPLIGQDSSFQLKQLNRLINKELIGKFFNLIYRLFSLIKQKIGLNIPIILEPKVNELKEILKYKLTNFDSKGYVDTIIKLSTEANEYIENNKLWNGIKQEHLNYLIPLIDNLIYYSSSFIINLPVKEFYSYKKNEFILLKLKSFFTKIEIDTTNK